MDQGSDDIRQDIDQTRAALDDKLSLLEGKASEVADNVRQAFDVKAQVNERPWMALGAAVLAGYVLGNLGNDDGDEQRWSGAPQTTTDYNQHAGTQSAGYGAPSTASSIKASASDFLGQFDDEINLLKGAAFATITDLLRQTVREVAPQIGDRLDTMIQERTGVSLSALSSGNGGKTVSSSPGQSFSATNRASADYDEIGQMNRVGAPPDVSNGGSEYFETYSPTPDKQDERSRSVIKTYNQ